MPFQGIIQGWHFSSQILISTKEEAARRSTVYQHLTEFEATTIDRTATKMRILVSAFEEIAVGLGSGLGQPLDWWPAVFPMETLHSTRTGTPTGTMFAMFGQRFNCKV